MLGADPIQRKNSEGGNRKKSFHERQMDNLQRINRFEHIRKMQLNKIRIDNATNWDVAKFEHFVAKDGKDYEASESEL